MKKRYNYLLGLLFSMAVVSVQAQIYVNGNASGSNDGSSWANAYTDLQDALDSSSPNDQVWVASGTYKPGGDSPTVDSYYSFPHDLQLYGGFAGTESALSERDIAANETILSADHNGDDEEDNYVDFRTDNSKHVMWLEDTVTTASIVDGFTIRNGNTEPQAGSGNDRRGGGILTYGAPTIRNCTFTQNYGYFGGGLYPRGSGAAGILIEDCIFERNQAGFGAGIYINSTTGTIQSCEFDGNFANSSGGGIYNNTANGAMISDCLFNMNRTQEFRGGGIYISSSPSTVTSCTFTGNASSVSSGGSIQVRSDDDDPIIEVNIMDCAFSDSEARFGGAIGSYDQQTVTNVSNCSFEDCMSANVGGAISNAFGSTTNITMCNFEGNTSDFGGAVYSQNDSASINITSSAFISNVASTTGGAINISADGEIGALLPMLTLDKCSFLLNNAEGQGGALNLGNGNASIVNCEFGSNLTTNGDGIGGAISVNASDSLDLTVSIMNSSIVNNFAEIGAGISQWTEGIGTAELTIQNTICYNPLGSNYEIEDGSPTVVSNGGNLSSDGTMTSELTGTNDINDTDPLLVNYLAGDYALMNDSPAVDTGVETGAPTTDIEGNSRVDQIDKGAYENQKLVSTRDLEQSLKALTLFPNPVVNELQFSLESEWQGELSVTITDMKGAIITSERIVKHNDILIDSYNVAHLSAGVYQFNVSDGKVVVSRSFIK